MQCARFWRPRDPERAQVTTAATLRFVTVIGLCFGGGQIALGLAGRLLGFLILWGLALIEERLERDQRADLTIETDVRAPEFLADFARQPACSGSSGRPWRSARELPWRRAPL
jgi:uncharacterized membrane protein YhiD involved in acid resistance